jgi:hypothetical protein
VVAVRRHVGLITLYEAGGCVLATHAARNIVHLLVLPLLIVGLVLVAVPITTRYIMEGGTF